MTGRAAGGRSGTPAKVGVFAGATAGMVGLTAAFKAGFDEMAEGQKVAAQTAAALKSTSGAAGVTAGQIDQLAQSLSKMSGVDDEAIQAGENLLLTFTRIRNEVGAGNDIFDQATAAALDMSVALDQDLSSSVMQLGKALNDPVRGLTTLRRVGVAFSDSQVKMITRLAESGRVMEAQKIILAELRREFGGSAKAAGDTFPGKLNKLRNAFDNLAGKIVESASPALGDFVDRLTLWLEDADNQQQVIDNFATAMHGLGDAIEFTADMFGTLKDAWDKLPDFGKDKGLFDLINLPGKNKGLLELLGITGGGGGGGLTGTVGGGGDFGPTGLPVGAAAGGRLPSFDETLRNALPKRASAEQRNVWFDAIINRELGRVQDIATLKGQIGRLQQIAGLIQQRLAATKDVTRRLTLEDKLLDVQRTIRADQAELAADAAAAAKAAAEAAKERQAAAQQALFDRLQLKVDRAALTDTLKDDLARLLDYQAAVRKIIATQGSTLALQERLLVIEIGIKDKQQLIADNRKQAAKAARDAAVAAREAKQFVALGFTEEGLERVPGAKALQTQANKLTRALRGTILDTKSNRSILRRIREVLSGELGAIGRTMRERIQQMIDDLNQQLEGKKKRRRRKMIGGIFVDAQGNAIGPGLPAEAAPNPIHIQIGKFTDAVKEATVALNSLEKLRLFADLRQFGGNLWSRVGAAALGGSPGAAGSRLMPMPRISRFGGGTQPGLPFGGGGRHLLGGVTVVQNFNAPTTDRHREARYALMATRTVFDG